jgi:hypothetical protein
MHLVASGRQPPVGLDGARGAVAGGGDVAIARNESGEKGYGDSSRANSSIRVTASGDFLVATPDIHSLVRLDPTGKEKWRLPVDGMLADLRVQADRALLLVSQTVPPIGAGSTVIRVGTDGKSAQHDYLGPWEKLLPADDGGFTLVHTEQSEFGLARVGADDVEQWRQTYLNGAGDVQVTSDGYVASVTAKDDKQPPRPLFLDAAGEAQTRTAVLGE